MTSIVRSIFITFGLCLLASFATAAPFTVNKTADTNDGTCDADCSLREAVAAANGAAGADTIDFSSLFNTVQTITLSGTDLILTSGGLTITGPGADKLTVSGNNTSRVFTNNTGAVTTISGIRVTGGTGVSTVTTGRGGGVYNNAGTLTLVALVITGNAAANGGGANNAGTATLNIVDCVIFGNTVTGAGGALQNFSGNTTNISGSSIYGNTSNSASTGGGAIQANGTVSISNTTIANNNAVGGSGGAIFYNGTLLTLNNVTISGNTATNISGGINKTTANNGFARNSIIAGNTGGASPDFSGVANSLGNNIIGTVGSSSGWIGSDLQNTNAMLGTFGFNGGTGNSFIPLPGSPAINGGDNCVLDLSCPSGNPLAAITADQRGVSRPSASTVDIGAVEAANSTITGRVFSATGSPIRNAKVSIVSPVGNFVALTNGFGIYKIEGVQIGNAITASVTSKSGTFSDQMVVVLGATLSLDFTATSIVEKGEIRK
jgi:CSLREA domain-containing protein